MSRKQESYLASQSTHVIERSNMCLVYQLCRIVLGVTPPVVHIPRFTVRNGGQEVRFVSHFDTIMSDGGFRLHNMKKISVIDGLII